MDGVISTYNLVGGLDFFIFPYKRNNQYSSQVTFIFFRGFKPSTSIVYFNDYSDYHGIIKATIVNGLLYCSEGFVQPPTSITFVKNTMFFLGSSRNSMAMFNRFVKLPDGNRPSFFCYSGRPWSWSAPQRWRRAARSVRRGDTVTRWSGGRCGVRGMRSVADFLKNMVSYGTFWSLTTCPTYCNLK